MSIFSELLPKILEISQSTARNLDKHLKEALLEFDKIEEEYMNGRKSVRDRATKDKNRTTTLQSINEDDDEIKISQNTHVADKRETSPESGDNRRGSKKRSKDEAEDILSPEQDKRQKRNASVKAQSSIAKQLDRETLKELNENGVAFVSSTTVVNVNLTQKMRREGSTDKSRSRRRKEEDKENTLVAPPVQIKQEKVSLPPEPMDVASLPLAVVTKQEGVGDIAMPPPVAPVPKSRKGVQKEKSEETSDEETGPGKRRTTRPKKFTDTMPPPPVPSARSTRAGTRASSRATRQAELEQEPPEPRPKRTRAKKKVSETSIKSEKDPAQEDEIGSPAEKPRPKRTRRGRKAAENESKKSIESQKSQETDLELISPKKERISEPKAQSPILQKGTKSTKNIKKQKSDEKKTTKENEKLLNTVEIEDTVVGNDVVLDETRVLEKINATVTISSDMDKSMILPNGVYSHAQSIPTACNETVVIETCDRQTMVLDRPHLNDATVIIDKDTKPTDTIEDSSLMTDDNSDHEYTPPKSKPKPQPSSAVKEKVQQFEELAARTTRTKTRAMAKMDDQDNQTPPDKMIKPGLSADTLNKMHNMIFNGKPAQISSSASKARIPVPVKPKQPSTASKLSSVQRHREAAEESVRSDREDARRKKEAMLEAKRELQKKKREDKMAAAAAAREAAERERRLAMEAALKDKMCKQAHADQGKLERLKEVERKKLELARKVAETEERRRAEEQARQQRLEEEQKRADAARRKQLEEAEVMKKEAAIMAKEIEKRQKEYMEKHKMKHKLENGTTPLKAATGGAAGGALEPAYMCDGFQHLHSDEDEEPVRRPVPAWSTSAARKQTLIHQSQISPALIGQLFGVRVHSPNLREIFPQIERARLKRTSSAVWRTPPV